jgi:hypothetical protein
MFSVAELADERFLAQGIAIHCYFEELPASPRLSVAAFELVAIELSNRRTELALFDSSVLMNAGACAGRLGQPDGPSIFRFSRGLVPA